jgi:hypothetical protein
MRRASPFRQADVERAIRSARAAGVRVEVVEIIVGDVTIRVLGDRAVPPAAEPIIRSANEWDAEIEKLKKKDR